MDGNSEFFHNHRELWTGILWILLFWIFTRFEEYCNICCNSRGNHPVIPVRKYRLFAHCWWSKKKVEGNQWFSGYYMVGICSKPMFFYWKLFKMPFCWSGIYRLQSGTEVWIAFPYFFPLKNSFLISKSSRSRRKEAYDFSHRRNCDNFIYWVYIWIMCW